MWGLVIVVLVVLACLLNASLHTSAKVTLRPSAASYGHSDMTNTALLSCRECLKDDPTPEKGESSLLDWVSVTTRWWLRVSS